MDIFKLQNLKNNLQKNKKIEKILNKKRRFNKNLKRMKKI